MSYPKDIIFVKMFPQTFDIKCIYISRIVDSCPYNALYPKDIRGTF